MDSSWKSDYRWYQLIEMTQNMSQSTGNKFDEFPMNLKRLESDKPQKRIGMADRNLNVFNPDRNSNSFWKLIYSNV